MEKRKEDEEKHSLLPPGLFIICVIVMVFLRMLWPQPSLIRWPANLVGAPVLLGGLAASMRGSLTFQRLGTNIHTFRDPDRLVVGGLYRYSRNPMYVGTAAALAGTALLLGTMLPFAVVALFIGITDRWYIRFEEEAMSRKFGTDYDLYRKKTRRWM